MQNMLQEDKKRGRPKSHEFPFICCACKRSQIDFPTLRYASRGRCVGCASVAYEKAKKEKKKIIQQSKVTLSKVDSSLIEKIDAIQLKEMLDKIRMLDFPYPVYNSEELKKDFKNLQELGTQQFEKENLIAGSVVGIKVASQFCKSRFDVTKKGKVSAISAFNDPESLRIIASKMLLKEEGEKKLTAAKLLSYIYRANGVAFVSNFRPVNAKFLYEKFCPKSGVVYDFCSGFGGRLTGAASCDVGKYIGIEPNTKAFNELLLLKDWLKENGSNLDVELTQSCAEDFCPEEYHEQIDFVFSSPPYFDTECYSQEETQSCLRYPSHKEWRVSFLQKTFENVYKLLKKDRIFAINIANTISATLEADAIYFAKKCGFKLKDIYQMKLREHTEGFSKTSAAEPIFIFRKLA